MALDKLTKPRARWITFKLKVAGAVSRALADRLVESGISITDLGATDGQDSTDAMEAALSIVVLTPHKLIVVPEGIFITSRALAVPVNTHIKSLLKKRKY